MKQAFSFILCILFLLARPSQAQDTHPDSLLNLLPEDSTEESIQLLPEKIDFGKHWLWGERGLLRKTNAFPLTAEGRAREMNVRRKMLVAHQFAGYVSTALIVATAVTGYQTQKGKWDKDIHEATQGALGISYAATGILSIFSPPPLIFRKEKGLSNIKVHKALAYLHIGGMVVNGVFGEEIAERNNKLHRIVGYTTAGALVGAMVVMKF